MVLVDRDPVVDPGLRAGETKRGILGENAARILGLDIAAFRRRTRGDEFAKPRELEPAWSSWRRGGNARERGQPGVSGQASDTDPPRVTADAIWKVLEGIVDPCSKAVGAPVGLASMGLVLDVCVSGAPGAAIVNVQLGITEPGCMMQGIFSATADREIRALPGVADVVVRIDHGYVWGPDDMAAEYRALLAKLRTEWRLRAEDRLLQDSKPRES